MSEKNPHLPIEPGENPITAAIPQVAQQYQDLSHAPATAPAKAKVPTQLKVMILASFVIALGFGLIAPVLPRYAASFDVGAMAASAVVSMFAVTRLVFAPAAGKWISKFGERRMYILGLFIVALGSFGTAFTWNYTSLLAMRALGGIGSVMFTVSAMGLLVRHSPPTLRGRISGYYATSFLLGNILGPVAGSAMAGLGMRLPFVLYGCALLIAMTVIGIFLREKPTDIDYTSSMPIVKKGELAFKDALKFSNYKAGLFGNFALGWAAFGLRIALMPLAAVALLTAYHAGENYDAAAGGTVLSGIAMATYAAGNAISQNVAGAISDKNGRRGPIFWGMLFGFACTVVVGFAPNPIIFVVFSGLTGIGIGFVAPSLQASIADIVGNNRNGGQVLAIYQMANDLGQIIGPILAGAIADRFGFGVAFSASAVLLLLTCIGYIPGRKPKFPAELADSDYTGK